MEGFHKKGGFKKPTFGGNASFNGPRHFGGKSSGRPGGFHSGPREQATMHQATCNECGKDCQVPFRPSGERPVYCRDCFAKNAPPRTPSDGYKKNFDTRGPDSRPRFEAPALGKGDSQILEATKQLQGVNAKLDRLIELMEKQAHATGVKDVLKTIDGAFPKVKVRKSAKK